MPGRSKQSDAQYDLSNKQARIDKKQFGFSLAFAFVAIIMGIVPLITNANKDFHESLERTQQQQSEIIKVLSVNLDSLHRQVKSLEKQMEQVKKNIEQDSLLTTIFKVP